MLIHVLFAAAVLVTTQGGGGFAALNDALAHGSAADLREVASALREQAGPANRSAQVYAAFAFWRLGIIGEAADQPQALRDCVSLSDLQDEEHADAAFALAVRGSCLGMLASLEPAMAMVHGSRSATAMQEADFRAPDGPRVQLLLAIADFKTPLQWGGDRDRAIRRLNAAIERIEVDGVPTDPWVLPEALGFLALVNADLGRCRAATSSLDRGLKVAPELSFLRNSVAASVSACASP